jgi:Mg-chelatase subunit ChlI
MWAITLASDFCSVARIDEKRRAWVLLRPAITLASSAGRTHPPLVDDDEAHIADSPLRAATERFGAKLDALHAAPSLTPAREELRKRNDPKYVRQPERSEAIIIGNMQDFDRRAAIEMGIKPRRSRKSPQNPDSP